MASSFLFHLLLMAVLRPTEFKGDGIWSEWGDFSSCSGTCGKVGHKWRQRTCRLNPPCLDWSKEEVQCNMDKCPHGKWRSWSEPGPCVSPDCHETTEQGLQYSTRRCSIGGGEMCTGPFLRADTCFEPENCPVNGNWGSWSEWECKGEVVRRWSRCNDPPPSNGGRNCDGKMVKKERFHRLSNRHLFEEICNGGLRVEEGSGQASGSGDGSKETADINDD